MERLIEALELAVRDHDWHRVRVAVAALRASLVAEKPVESKAKGKKES